MLVKCGWMTDNALSVLRICHDLSLFVLETTTDCSRGKRLMTNEFSANEYQAAQQARAEVMNALSADDLAALGGAYNFEQAVIENDQFGNINYVTTDLHMDSQTGAMAPIRIAVPRAMFIPPPGAETTNLAYTKLAVRRFARHAMIGAIHAANLMTGTGPGV